MSNTVNELDLIDLEKVIQANFRAGQNDPELAFDLIDEYNAKFNDYNNGEDDE